MTLEDLHQTVVEGFSRIDGRFARIEDRLAQNDARWAQNETRLREEGETTRRHFDAVAERVEAAVRIVAEGHGHLQTVLDNHEARPQTLEKRS